MTREAPRLVGIILAGGASRRMGRPKQLLPLAGRPVLQHVIGTARGSMLAETVLVLGHAAAEIQAALVMPVGCRVVVNAQHAAGQSSSLACGLAAISRDGAVAAVVLLGDQPGVTSALIDRVAGAFLAGDHAAVRPVWTTAGTASPGHPVVLARRLWPLLTTVRGDQGARELFAAHPEWLQEVMVPGAAPSDIDDDEDYRRMLVATGDALTGG